MSIKTGKQDYDAVTEFTHRTNGELGHREGELYKRDTEPNPIDVDFVATRLRGHTRVLELGSGFGIWARVAIEAGCDWYVGVEPVHERYRHALERLEAARDRNEAWAVRDIVRFRTGDARIERQFAVFGGLTDGLTNHSKRSQYDAVLFVTVLQHMTLEDAIRALKTAAWHMSDDGEIILLESLLLDVDAKECEEMYAAPSWPKHMVPKPRAVLEAEVPELIWARTDRADGFVLTRRESYRGWTRLTSTFEPAPTLGADEIIEVDTATGTYRTSKGQSGRVVPE